MEAQALSGDSRQRLAAEGEAAAEAELTRLGLHVLERRYRRRFGEIDLIATEGARLVFVEVKARRGMGYGAPSEAVNRRKQRRIARVALAFLQQRGWLDRHCRFDVIEVLVGPDASHVRHIPDAFRVEARRRGRRD